MHSGWRRGCHRCGSSTGARGGQLGVGCRGAPRSVGDGLPGGERKMRNVLVAYHTPLCRQRSQDRFGHIGATDQRHELRDREQNRSVGVAVARKARPRLAWRAGGGRSSTAPQILELPFLRLPPGGNKGLDCLRWESGNWPTRQTPVSSARASPPRLRFRTTGRASTRRGRPWRPRIPVGSAGERP